MGSDKIGQYAQIGHMVGMGCIRKIRIYEAMSDKTTKTDIGDKMDAMDILEFTAHIGQMLTNLTEAVARSIVDNADVSDIDAIVSHILADVAFVASKTKEADPTFVQFSVN